MFTSLLSRVRGRNANSKNDDNDLPAPVTGKSRWKRLDLSINSSDANANVASGVGSSGNSVRSLSGATISAPIPRPSPYSITGMDDHTGVWRPQPSPHSAPPFRQESGSSSGSSHSHINLNALHHGQDGTRAGGGSGRFPWTSSDEDLPRNIHSLFPMPPEHPSPGAMQHSMSVSSPTSHVHPIARTLSSPPISTSSTGSTSSSATITTSPPAGRWGLRVYTNPNVELDQAMLSQEPNYPYSQFPINIQPGQNTSRINDSLGYGQPYPLISTLSPIAEQDYVSPELNDTKRLPSQSSLNQVYAEVSPSITRAHANASPSAESYLSEITRPSPVYSAFINRPLKRTQSQNSHISSTSSLQQGPIQSAVQTSPSSSTAQRVYPSVQHHASHLPGYTPPPPSAASSVSRTPDLPTPQIVYPNRPRRATVPGPALPTIAGSTEGHNGNGNGSGRSAHDHGGSSDNDSTPTSNEHHGIHLAVGGDVRGASREGGNTISVGEDSFITATDNSPDASRRSAVGTVHSTASNPALEGHPPLPIFGPVTPPTPTSGQLIPPNNQWVRRPIGRDPVPIQGYYNLPGGKIVRIVPMDDYESDDYDSDEYEDSMIEGYENVDIEKLPYDVAPYDPYREAGYDRYTIPQADKGKNIIRDPIPSSEGFPSNLPSRSGTGESQAASDLQSQKDYSPHDGAASIISPVGTGRFGGEGDVDMTPTPARRTLASQPSAGSEGWITRRWERDIVYGESIRATSTIYRNSGLASPASGNAPRLPNIDGTVYPANGGVGPLPPGVQLSPTTGLPRHRPSRPRVINGMTIPTMRAKRKWINATPAFWTFWLGFIFPVLWLIGGWHFTHFGEQPPKMTFWEFYFNTGFWKELFSCGLLRKKKNVVISSAPGGVVDLTGHLEEEEVAWGVNGHGVKVPVKRAAVDNRRKKTQTGGKGKEKEGGTQNPPSVPKWVADKQRTATSRARLYDPKRSLRGISFGYPFIPRPLPDSISTNGSSSGVVAWIARAPSTIVGLFSGPHKLFDAFYGVKLKEVRGRPESSRRRFDPWIQRCRYAFCWGVLVAGIGLLTAATYLVIWNTRSLR